MCACSLVVQCNLSLYVCANSFVDRVRFVLCECPFSCVSACVCGLVFLSCDWRPRCLERHACARGWRGEKETCNAARRWCCWWSREVDERLSGPSFGCARLWVCLCVLVPVLARVVLLFMWYSCFAFVHSCSVFVLYLRSCPFVLYSRSCSFVLYLWTCSVFALYLWSCACKRERKGGKKGPFAIFWAEFHVFIHPSLSPIFPRLFLKRATVVNNSHACLSQCINGRRNDWVEGIDVVLALSLVLRCLRLCAPRAGSYQPLLTIECLHAFAFFALSSFLVSSICVSSLVLVESIQSAGAAGGSFF